MAPFLVLWWNRSKRINTAWYLMDMYRFHTYLFLGIWITPKWQNKCRDNSIQALSFCSERVSVEVMTYLSFTNYSPIVNYFIPAWKLFCLHYSLYTVDRSSWITRFIMFFPSFSSCYFLLYFNDHQYKQKWKKRRHLL